MPDNGIPSSTTASSARTDMPEGFSPKRATMIRWISLVLILLAVLLFARALPTEKLLGVIQTWIDGLGIWGPVALEAIYILATLLFIPGAVLTLAAGAIYGLFQGLVIVSLASTTAAAFAFLIARYFARDKVRTWIKQSPKLTAVDGAIGEQGWKIVALLRLSPAVPFNLQNYLYGVTAIRFWPCVLTSWVAMLPGTFMYVYLGSVGASAAAGRDTSSAEWALRVVGLLATIIVSVYIAKLAQNAIKERTAIGGKVDEPSHAPNRSDASTDPNENEISGGKHYALLAAAVLLFCLSVWAFTRRDIVKHSIEGLFSAPPTVTRSDPRDQCLLDYNLPNEKFRGCGGSLDIWQL